MNYYFARNKKILKLSENLLEDKKIYEEINAKYYYLRYILFNN